MSILLVIAIAVGLCSCGNVNVEKTKYSGEIWDTFDTVIYVMAYCESEEEFNSIYNLAKEKFEYYDTLFDIYNDCEIDGINNAKTINDNAGNNMVTVPKELYDLIEYGVEMYNTTKGYVNIAFGSVLKLWHEARELAEENPEAAYVPSNEDLQAANLHCDINNVVLNNSNENYSVYLKDESMSLDLGSLAKGYATELVAKDISEMGNDCFLISAGSSSIKSVGLKPDGSSWTSAVEKDPDYDYIYISDYSISSSGNYQRYYDYNGVRYHHIINKDTLMPENNFISVTVIAKDCGLIDGLSTAIYNMSLQEGLDFIESLDDVYAMWVCNDNTKYYSEGYTDFLNN